MRHSCFHNLSTDLHETSQEAAEGSGGFEEEACEGDRRLLFPWVHWIDYEHFAGVSHTLKPVGLENWQHGHKDNPASYFRHTLHCRAPTALKWTGLLLNMIKRNKCWRSNSKKAARKWGECDISFSLHLSLHTGSQVVDYLISKSQVYKKNKKLFTSGTDMNVNFPRVWISVLMVSGCMKSVLLKFTQV